MNDMFYVKNLAGETMMVYAVEHGEKRDIWFLFYFGEYGWVWDKAAKYAPIILTQVPSC